MLNHRSDLSRFDYLLAGIAVICGILATAQSLQNLPMGLVLSAVVAVGLACSEQIARQPLAERGIDGLGMVGAGVMSLAFFPAFNSVMPGGGLPAELPQSSVLMWMATLGAFFAWRDGTLLFLVVPSIASFGLVGAYDTFPESPAVFFVFLACLAVLFARSNMRTVVRKASEHGHDPRQLDRYEWSGLAGPAWALGSALVVLALSLVGAPVLRQSVQGATANLNYDNPAVQAIRRQQRQQQQASALQTGDRVRVGSGPFGTPSEQPILVYESDLPIYLRQRVYADYNQGQWEAVSGPPETFAGGPGRPYRFEIRREGVPLVFGVQALVSLGPVVPHPAELLELDLDRSTVFRNIDESVVIQGTIPNGGSYSGVALIPNNRAGQTGRSVAKGIQPPELARIYTEFESTDRVSQFAKQAIEGISDDYEKALVLQRAVTQRITYNLQAPSVPPGADSADHVLFEKQEGYCDLFATALAQSARAVGLVARVATGYLVEEQSRDGNAFIIRSRHAHMWTEIYFENTGWVTFDATDGAREIPGQGRGSAVRPSEPWYRRILTGDVRAVLLGFLALAGLGAAAWIVSQIVANRGAFTHLVAQVTTKSEGEVAAMRVIRQIERASGQPRRFEQTVPEYLSTLPAESAALARALDEALYRPASIPDSLQSDAQAFLAALRKAQSEKS